MGPLNINENPIRMSRWKLGSMIRINGLFHLLINGLYNILNNIVNINSKELVDQLGTPTEGTPLNNMFNKFF